MRRFWAPLYPLKPVLAIIASKHFNKFLGHDLPLWKSRRARLAVIKRYLAKHPFAPSPPAVFNTFPTSEVKLTGL